MLDENEIMTFMDIRDALIEISQTLRQLLEFLKEKESNTNK